MKKYLLVVLSIFFFSTAWAAEGQLNAYAYGASFTYAPETQTIAFNWSQQAEASVVRIVAIDEDGNKYILKKYDQAPTSGGAYRTEMSIWDAVDIDRLPTNQNLKVAIELKTSNRSGHEVISSVKHIMQSPFSIDIDNNPKSRFFGLKYATQMDASSSLARGIYMFDQFNNKLRDAQMGSGITLYDAWFNETHGLPHMVRALPDGSGRLLITHADRSQGTYLWLAEPDFSAGNAAVPEYPTWKTIITNDQLANWMGCAGSALANVGMDIRENGDNWEIVLYSAIPAAIDQGGFVVGSVYTGIYSVSKSSQDLTGGTYTNYTIHGDSEITTNYTGSFLNGSANFDKFGGVLFNALSDSYSPTAPALKHRTLSGDLKTDYVDPEGNFLTRTIMTKGARFSPDFKKLAISQNASKADANGTELRIYDVTQTDGNSHISLSNGVSVDVISGSDEKAYVHDIAWDYGQNVYITVRNQSTKVNDTYLHGIYAVATDLNGAYISTPLTTPSGEETFRIDCTGSYAITLGQTGGTGTLTGAGTYTACSQVTVTATPDNQCKFIRWLEGGVEVSKNQTYTFTANKNRYLIAEFEYAVYNVEWYNLFEEGKDITTIGVDNHDNNVNNRLWYLFLAALKETGATITDHGNVWQKEDSKNAFWVAKTLETVSSDALNNFLTNTESKFYWLGKYILDTTGETIDNKYDWTYLLHLFFNRTKWCYNVNGGSNVNSYIEDQFNNSTIPDFTEKGHPDYWRKYWTRYACNLPMELSYDQSLPTDWNKIAKPSTYVTYEPTWYKWNNVWSPPYNGNNHTHILAWRVGSATGEIVNHVPSPEPGQESVKLYATYIKKHIHENDPDLDPNDKCDAKNSDVLKLLFNDRWDGAWHKITITRKLQAGMYNTICLPFNVNLETSLPADGSLDEAEFWQYDGTVSSTYNQSGEPVSVLNFTRVTDQLVAGTPYLVEVKKDVTNDLFFSGALDYDGISVLCDTTLRPVIADPEAEVKINFIGTINPTTIPDGALILVANNRLAMSTGGRMNGMRGYFVMDISDPIAAAELAEQAADGRVYLSMKKPVTTSIPVAPEAEQQVKPEVRKVMYEGKIYILRGEEVYTITGNRVR